MRFKPGELCYWKTRKWVYLGDETHYKSDYLLVQFVGKKEPLKGTVPSSDPKDESYVVWLVESSYSGIQERVVKDSELFGKAAIESPLWKELL